MPLSALKPSPSQPISSNWCRWYPSTTYRGPWPARRQPECTGGSGQCRAAVGFRVHKAMRTLRSADQARRSCPLPQWYRAALTAQVVTHLVLAGLKHTRVETLANRRAYWA